MHARPAQAIAALGLAAALLATSVALAQQRGPVSRAQSSVLLDMPALEDGVEQFQYLGWDSSFASETSLAVVNARGAAFPVAAVMRQQLGKNWVWQVADLDEGWIRQTAFLLRDRPIRITRPAHVGSDRYLNTVLFTSGDVACVGFDFRRRPQGIVDAQGGEVGHRGFYCGAPGAALGESDIARIVAGIYERTGDGLRRAYALDTSPIPDRAKR